ncbi:cell division protein FtsQ [Streptomyces pluripotens]|uniref:Cell division protein FtsQ n=1 Tax=Streptomyces pluripotens TaxID=1355015 RepID=A0A221P8G8_9ACTN|nr:MULTISPECIES: FtsQ-type POTRA domain-containing protein [Streptomyces]ARP74015.1 cell division protein FtsQ [Streptomyces pluripotens]ASN28278.1 cell division protein FtsQ [Streptomyces pluripotens]KIE24210.1 cell division protein FtsQ [Streptomyces sp. MUSC 125]MCH0555711.1 FtsQ-type POTRA domain-containing protein [Streptomyces sp. MUM 16J]
MAGPTTAERGERQQESSGPRSARRRLRVIVILAVVTVLLGVGGTWVLYGSDWLRVGHVSVSGTRVLTPAEVRKAAAVPVGAPMISIDTEGIEARLRRKLPRISTVDVVRSWPHGIGLKVTERIPVLLVQKSGQFVEVDDEGVRFATVPQAPEDVPLLKLSVSRRGSGAASLRRFGVDRLVREAVQVTGDLPAAVSRDTRTVQVRSYDDISLELVGARTVLWGSGEDGRTKARALTALMKAAPGARHFDVSAPIAPASSGS